MYYVSGSSNCGDNTPFLMVTSCLEMYQPPLVFSTVQLRTPMLLACRCTQLSFWISSECVFHLLWCSSLLPYIMSAGVRRASSYPVSYQLLWNVLLVLCIWPWFILSSWWVFYCNLNGGPVELIVSIVIAIEMGLKPCLSFPHAGCHVL